MGTTDDKKHLELVSLKTELRTLIGHGIIAGLINPGASGVGDFANLFAALDYNQAGGNYTQSGGGNYTQNGGGNYNQSAIFQRNRLDEIVTPTISGKLE